MNCSMSLIYGVIAMISLLLVVGYCSFVKKKELWFLLLFISAFIVNTGYFALSISKTLEEALLANRISYLGSVFLPLCMLMIIMSVCDLRPRKLVTGALVGVSALVFLLAASGGYLPLYYKEVTMEIIDGAAKLCKVYGPLHQLYFVYLFSYLIAMIVVIVYASPKKSGRLRKYAPIMYIVVILNVAIWFIEQMIHWDFEFLSLSYIVSELLLLCVYNILPQNEEEVPAETVRSGCCECPELSELTKRERDVLKLILENKKRKEIAEALFVTENTVKKHTSHIYEKLNVSDRSELLLKLGHTTL